MPASEDRWRMLDDSSPSMTGMWSMELAILARLQDSQKVAVAAVRNLVVTLVDVTVFVKVDSDVAGVVVVVVASGFVVMVSVAVTVTVVLLVAVMVAVPVTVLVVHSLW